MGTLAEDELGERRATPMQLVVMKTGRSRQGSPRRCRPPTGSTMPADRALARLLASADAPAGFRYDRVHILRSALVHGRGRGKGRAAE